MCYTVPKKQRELMEIVQMEFSAENTGRVVQAMSDCSAFAIGTSDLLVIHRFTGYEARMKIVAGWINDKVRDGEFMVGRGMKDKDVLALVVILCSINKQVLVLVHPQTRCVQGYVFSRSQLKTSMGAGTSSVSLYTATIQAWAEMVRLSDCSD